MVKKIIKKFLRNLGFEIQRATIQTSKSSKINRLFTYYNINLVLDVGANFGQYVTFLRDECGYSGRIVSFEPLSTAHSQLQTLSKKDPLWEIAPRTAIGNEEGEITINIAANSQSSSVLQMLDSHLQAAPESVYCSSETVKMSMLDSIAQGYIQDNSNVFLKIDVQGFEKQVIEGAKNLLPIIQGIQLELSLVPLYRDQLLFQDMLKLMEELGYELYGVIPGFTDPKTGRLLQMDGIFFKS
jgi:FkbM family methyltransferase